MRDENEKPKVPLEGLVYAEISAWITVVGMAIAVVGLGVGLLGGGRVIDEPGLMRDLFQGRGEDSIWTRDSSFARVPEEYWFLRHRMDGDELSMIGIVVACWGGVVGIWGLFASTLRRRVDPVRGRALYAILAFIVGTIMTLAATGVIALR